MDPIPMPDGPQPLSGVLQIALNEIAVGRVDIAIGILTLLIQQLQLSGS